MCYLPKIKNDNLLVGLDTSDDAAVYKINEDLAIIQTLDFFTPIVDDPYMYGQIAAANALSDIYAMGGEPIMALNIVCFPVCLPIDILGQILKGGADKVIEANAVLVGGHSVDDNEPKYGLSVTGTVSPDRIISNSESKPGDMLILTKPLGSGILNTAIKADMLSEKIAKNTTTIMASLNDIAAKGMKSVGVNSCTDITGFGFLGHGYEMAKASNVTFQIQSAHIPIMEETIQYAEMGLVPAGAYRNREYLKKEISFDSKVPTYMQDILFDPQTSGGLLISIAKEKVDLLVEFYTKNLKTDFAVVGEVLEKKENYIEVK